MNIVTGKIIEVDSAKRVYLIKTESRLIYKLFFEEVGFRRYYLNDFVEFESYNSTTEGFCAFNPRKIDDPNLKELILKHDLNKYIIGYIYGYNLGGYLVKYKSFRCFAPNVLNLDKAINDRDEILHTYQPFKIEEIKEKSIILSRKKILKLKKEELKNKEVRKLSIGENFIGTVQNVQGFGVFIKYVNSSGLVHFSKLSLSYESNISKLLREFIQTSLEVIFVKGLEVQVEVSTISENKYSLDIVKNSFNKEILNKIIKFNEKEKLLFSK